MTLESYGPERLDQLSLRLLDLCARLRAMARQAQIEQLPALDLHDRKALEWIDHLEGWLDRAQAEFDLAIVKHRAQRLAKKSQARRGK
jgi:hypothetical protein